MQAVRVFNYRACEFDNPAVVAERQRHDRNAPEKIGRSPRRWQRPRSRSRRAELTETNPAIIDCWPGLRGLASDDDQSAAFACGWCMRQPRQESRRRANRRAGIDANQSPFPFNPLALALLTARLLARPPPVFFSSAVGASFCTAFPPLPPQAESLTQVKAPSKRPATMF
jgi:hypothetical protein